ncbi:MAG TPA: hypothetical protein VGD14_04660 [bacterium]
MTKNKKLPDNFDNIVISEVELILSEKRTALSIMRTGIAVFALPLSVLSILIATSRFYNFNNVLHLIIPLLILCAILIFLGFYLIIRAIIKIRHYDRSINKLKRKHNLLSEIID